MGQKALVIEKPAWKNMFLIGEFRAISMANKIWSQPDYYPSSIRKRWTPARIEVRQVIQAHLGGWTTK